MPVYMDRHYVEGRHGMRWRARTIKIWRYGTNTPLSFLGLNYCQPACGKALCANRVRRYSSGVIAGRPVSSIL